MLDLFASRSLLFVPGDSERKQARGATSAADALILDLEDSVAVSRLPAAREMVRVLLLARADGAGPRLWVRINPLASPHALADLAAVVPGRPDGIVLPKAASASEVTVLGHHLAALEVAFGIPPATIAILPIATETPAALFTLGSYADPPLRLAGLTWGAEDLAAALGAAGNRDEGGEYAFTFRLARSLCLAAAHGAGVPAIDTVFTDFRDTPGCAREAALARRAGFSGKLAIHPDQVMPINEAFTPSEAEVAHARQVVALFDANPEAGAIGLDGQMLDRPHLIQARRTLAAASRPA